MLKTYEKKIDTIEHTIVEILSHLVKANKISLAGVIDKDSSRFKEAKDCVKKLNRECDDVDNDIVKTLALFSPEAKDLRKLVAYLKITNELTRAAQNIKSYNTNILKSYEDNDNYYTSSNHIETLQQATIKAFNNAIMIIHEEDVEILNELYHDILTQASQTETIYATVEKELIAPEKLSSEELASHLSILKTFRKLDNIMDRALNIANLMMFAKIGGEIHHH